MARIKMRRAGHFYRRVIFHNRSPSREGHLQQGKIALSGPIITLRPSRLRVDLSSPH